MKTLLRGAGRLAAGAIAALVCTGSAVAGGPAPVVQLPNPGALTLVSTAIVGAVIATRWLRRK